MNELLVGYARVSTEQQDLTAQRNGLHAPGRQTGPNGLPQQRADFVTEQAIDDVARCAGALSALAAAAPGLHVTTAVTCPTVRVHPAVIAQAAALVAGARA